jgi:hypothetical protein
MAVALKVLEIRKPQVILDSRGTLVVVDGAAFGCEVFASVRLIGLSPGETVQLASGRHVIVLIKGVVTVNGAANELILDDLNQVVVVDGEPIGIEPTDASTARVVILSNAGNLSGDVEGCADKLAQFCEVHVKESTLNSLNVDWASQSPFSIRRAYFTHSVGSGAERGGHAHRRLRQLLVAAHGEIDLRLQGPGGELDVRLEKPNHGVLVQPVAWREISMHEGSHLMVLASEPYDEREYIRDYAVFVDETS